MQARSDEVVGLAGRAIQVHECEARLPQDRAGNLQLRLLSGHFCCNSWQVGKGEPIWHPDDRCCTAPLPVSRVS